MTAITLWVASAALGGVAAILHLLAGDVIPESPVVFGRSTGFTTHPNELGALTAIALVPAFMLAARDHISRRERVVSYGLLLLVGTGLILSGSVSALLAAVAAVFTWLALGNRSRNTMRVYAATAVGVIAITIAQGVLGGQTPWERFVRVTDTSYGASNGAGSLQSRISTYQAALARIDEQPFLGVGLDLLSVTATTSPTGTVVDDHDVHNIVIGTWFKTGLLGVLGIVIAFVAIFREGWKGMVRARSADERAAALALFCAVVGFVVFAMGQPVLYSRIGWICAAFVIALRAVQDQADERAAARVYQAAKTLRGPVSLEAGRP
jgi:O-antigen ligase